MNDAPPPVRPQFTDQTSWSVHADAERQWLYDAVEWLLQRERLASEKDKARTD